VDSPRGEVSRIRYAPTGDAARISARSIDAYHRHAPQCWPRPPTGRQRRRSRAPRDLRPDERGPAVSLGPSDGVSPSGCAPRSCDRAHTHPRC
jgi:hypothetical protein